MGSEPDDEQAREQSREAFIAGMKTRLERARASGQSPEQIQELVSACVKEETRRQIPQVAARARAWWSGFRNFLIVGALALGVAIGLALFVEHHYAAPLCEQYAAQHDGLRYDGIDYPTVGRSSSTTSPPRCMFVDPAGHRDTVSLDELQPNAIAALLTSFALQISFVTPVAFILIALSAVSLRRSTTRLN
jgi:hypothetical protein